MTGSGGTVNKTSIAPEPVYAKWPGDRVVNFVRTQRERMQLADWSTRGPAGLQLPAVEGRLSGM